MSQKSLLSRLKGTAFRRLTGVTQEIFAQMVLQCAKEWEKCENAKQISGRPHGIGGLAEHIFLMLLLYRCHITQEFAGALFHVDNPAFAVRSSASRASPLKFSA